MALSKQRVHSKETEDQRDKGKRISESKGKVFCEEKKIFNSIKKAEWLNMIKC